MMVAVPRNHRGDPASVTPGSILGVSQGALDRFLMPRTRPYVSLRQRSSVSENPFHSRPSGNSQGFLTKVNVNSAFAGSCANSTTHSPSGVWLVAVLTGPSGGS